MLSPMLREPITTKIADRFRGFLPVVVDVETGGFNAATDALLEVSAVMIAMDHRGFIHPTTTHTYHVAPFKGANIEKASLDVTGIDPYHPLRPAVPENEALNRLFREVRRALKEENCNRAILVGHNAHFDLGFLNAALERTGVKRNPFHKFSAFDTATLGGVMLGQTVLARAVDAVGLDWDSREAHSAHYDAEKTCDLFCEITNRSQALYEASLEESDAPWPARS